jgi:ABC-type oligopeptide transport system ATPase subunit
MTAAPDGEHQVELKDTDGNEVKIRVQVKDGKIVQRENVEQEMENDMSAFMEAFASAMKKFETKLDEITNKQMLLEKSFKKFSNEPAGSMIKKQINPESFGTTTASSKFEGFKRLRDTMS